MVRKIKIIILLIMVLGLMPGLVKAKSYSDAVSKEVTLEGGSKITDYATVDNEYIKRLVIVNKDLVKSTTDVGDSEAILYSSDKLNGNFPGGAYALQTKKGTIKDLNFSTFYPEALKMGSRTYDVKVTVNSIYDEEDGLIVFGNGEIHVKLNEKGLPNNNSNRRYHGLNMHIDIFEKGTNKKAKIPDLVFLVADVDGVNTNVEGIKINDFIPNKNNTFVSSSNNTVKYNNFSYYGTASVEESPGGKGDVVFHISKLQNEGELDISYAAYASEVGTIIYFLAPQYKVNYKALEGGKITGISSEDKFSSEVVSGSKEEANDGYELAGWTCDKDVVIDEEKINKGNIINNEDLKKVKVTEDLTFTAQYNKKKYQITTSVVNGTIDESVEASHGDNQTIFYTSKEGYKLLSITVDGKSISLENNDSYTINNIKDNHDIKVF